MSLSACLCSLRRGHGLIPGITDLFAFGANLQISHALKYKSERSHTCRQTHVRPPQYAYPVQDGAVQMPEHKDRHGGGLVCARSSLSSATCLRLMKTSMCQCCPGVAKTKPTMYNHADKRCILSPPTQTPNPSCQSADGDTHTHAHTQGDRREKKEALPQ